MSAQAVCRVAGVVLHDDVPQSLELRAERAVCPVLPEMLQQPGVGIAGGVDPGLGPGGVLARADRTAVAALSLLVDQVGQQM
ncbi:hypothetical protein ACFVYV_52810 [Streptomyces mirabilis]|uniref:hypothetical protein n=1 Tax=Streptomyces mirabilis TaxID=68239 RepID=UPI0036DA67F3